MQDRTVSVYVALAFGITWGAGGLGLLVGAFDAHATPPRLHPLHYLAAFGPSLAGVFMVAHTAGRAGLRDLFRRAVPRWTRLGWYLAAIGGLVGANLLMTKVLAPAALVALPAWPLALRRLPLTFVGDTGPLGEEFGWRGFLLPRLLKRGTAMRAAVISGVIWFAWHLPTFFIATLSQSALSIPLFLANSLALSVLMTALYVRTDGDLFLMLLVHVLANFCGGIGVPFEAEVTAEVLLAVLVALPLLRDAGQRPGAAVVH